MAEVEVKMTDVYEFESSCIGCQYHTDACESLVDAASDEDWMPYLRIEMWPGNRHDPNAIKVTYFDDTGLS